MKKIKTTLAILCFSIVLLVGITPLAKAAETKEALPKASFGFIDLNLYPYDTRDLSTYTINLLANLPVRLQYFSFVNYTTPVSTTKNFDLQNFYTEQNLRWGLPKDLPLDATVQWVTQTGSPNDVLRLGMRWRLSNTPWLEQFFQKINMTYSINFHLLQMDFEPSPGWGFQIEHVYQINILPSFFDNRLYLSGYADHALNYGGSSAGNNHIWVSEHQLGYRLINWLYAITELRYNDFSAKKTGVGFGAEYKIQF